MRTARLCLRCLGQFGLLLVLLGGLVSVGLWARSYWIEESIVRHSYSATVRGAAVEIDGPEERWTSTAERPFPGGTFWWRCIRVQSSRGGVAMEYRVQARRYDQTEETTFEMAVGDLAFAKELAPSFSRNAPGAGPWFACPNVPTVAGFGGFFRGFSYWGLAVPYWLPAIVAAAIVVASVVRRRTRRKRELEPRHETRGELE
jgi:hypothetical protein